MARPQETSLTVKSGMITYRYSRRASGKICDMLTLEDDARRPDAPYSFFGCKTTRIPNIPKTNKAKYFSHKSNGRCSKETDLHSLAKETFYASYCNALREKLPFSFTYRRSSAFVDSQLALGWAS